MEKTGGDSWIPCLERRDLQPENLGLTLAEAKSILAGVQKSMVERQAEEFLHQEACCPLCGKRRLRKGHHTLGQWNKVENWRGALWVRFQFQPRQTRRADFTHRASSRPY